MKKMLLLLTVAALSFASAQAQTTPPANGGTFQGRGMGREQRTPEQRADMQTQRLTTQLGLTPEQQPKVRAIFLAQANELDAARANRTPGNVDRDALRQQMQEGRARYDEQLKAVLTPEQFGKYQQQRAERTERVGDMKEARKDGKLKAKKDKVKTKAS